MPEPQNPMSPNPAEYPPTVFVSMERDEKQKEFIAQVGALYSFLPFVICSNKYPCHISCKLAPLVSCCCCV